MHRDKLNFVLGCAFLVTATGAWGQGPASRAVKSSAVTNANVNKDKAMALRPPTGAKVAIVVFEDLECPDCARAAPLLQDVSKSQRVPLVRHDFPLPKHD